MLTDVGAGRRRRRIRKTDIRHIGNKDGLYALAERDRLRIVDVRKERGTMDRPKSSNRMK